MNKLSEKLGYIQTKFKAKKSRYNSFGKYYFRSAEDILEAIKPYLLELGVYITVDEQIDEMMDGLPVLKSTATISDGKDAIHTVAVVGIDLNQKGMNVPQQFGSASSYAKKYALGNLFLIDDTADSDATNDHSKSKPALSGKELDSAKAYMAKGGKIESIKSKYTVSKDVEKQLTTL
tara:strand:+ start:1070 stop:1600 length:531 start_codon:yes stop_codon:yes gene_type:complete